jgi:YVTN family beta-propeller protein
VLVVLAAPWHAPAAFASAFTKTIPVGVYPNAISADATHVWVANGGGTVSMIDKASATVVKTIPAGTDPYGISSDGTHVWVGNGGGTVTEIDAATGDVVKTIAIPGLTNPHGVSSDGTHVWVADPAAPGVQMIDAATGQYVKTIATPGGFRIASDGTHVWAPNWYANTITEIDAASGTVVKTIPVGRVPQGVAADGTRVWVSNATDKTITEIAAATGTVTRTIPIRAPAYGVSTDGTFVWAANPDDDTVTKIDAVSGAVYPPIPVGRYPEDVVSDGTDLWVPLEGENVVRRFRVALPVPAVTVANDASPLTATDVTFTATVTGSDGVAPTGPVTWIVTAPGGVRASCATMTGPTPTDQADIVTYTCMVARAQAGSATATYTPGDSNYQAAAPVTSKPAVGPWQACEAGQCVSTTFTRLPGLGPVSAELTAAAVGFARIDETLASKGTVSAILFPPAVTPTLPLVNVLTAAGGVTVNLGTGTTSTREQVTAEPPFSRPPAIEGLFDKVGFDTFWVVLDVAKWSRTVTVNMTSLDPSTLTGEFKHTHEAKLYLAWAGLVTVAVIASEEVLAAALARAAAAAEDVLEGQGFGVGAGAILNHLEAALSQAIQRAGTRLLDTLDRTVIGPAQSLWDSLSGSALRGAPARAASAPATQPTAVQPARVLALRRADLKHLRAQNLKGKLAKAASASLVTLPVSATVRPLIVSRRVGRTVAVLGGGLPGSKAALAVSGPGYSAVRQVRVEHGLAGGRVVLPRTRRKGPWHIGIVDYALVSAPHGRLSGRAVLEAAVLKST